MLQRRGNQIGLLVLRVFYFSPEMPTVFIWVHWQFLKLAGACLGERNDSVDTTVVISVHWLTGARFEAALSPLQVSAFLPGWGKANVKCILSHLVTSRYYF